VTCLTLQARVRCWFIPLWVLWWTKWHWDRGFSQYFCFPLSISLHRCSTFIYLLLWAGQWAKPGKLPCSYGSWGALGRKYCYLLWLRRLVPGCPCKIRGHFTWNLWWGRRKWAMYFRVVILPAALSMFVQRQTLPLAVSCLQADQPAGSGRHLWPQSLQLSIGNLKVMKM